MTYTIDVEPHTGRTIEIPPDSVTILIGKNASGKSKILESLKTQIPNSVFLRGNYESVQDITTISMASSAADQKRENTPVLVSSLIAADPELLKILQFYFSSLFAIDLKVKDNVFITNDKHIAREADGLKSLFNLSYYLLSPHKILLLDEPERFFHPSLSLLFLSLLSEIATNYEKQIVITTHTSELMRFDLNNVAVYRISNNPAGIFNINTWLSGITTTIYPDGKSIQSFKDWFFFHADIVFSKYAVLVEGFSDQIALEALKQKLSFEYRLEDTSIKPVASSHHEAGGKSRLHRMQTFLGTLVSAYAIVDKDIIGASLTKWYAYSPADSEAKIINDAKSVNLLILAKGELEDYYFIDASYDFCQSVAVAKANKIAAAYEQARIILSKPFNEVETQYRDIVDFFKAIIGHVDTTDDPLKSLAKDYLVETHIKKSRRSEHLREVDDGAKLKIAFNFTTSTRFYSIPKTSIARVDEVGEEIEKELKK